MDTSRPSTIRSTCNPMLPESVESPEKVEVAIAQQAKRSHRSVPENKYSRSKGRTRTHSCTRTHTRAHTHTPDHPVEAKLTSSSCVDAAASFSHTFCAMPTLGTNPGAETKRCPFRGFIGTSESPCLNWHQCGSLSQNLKQKTELQYNLVC